MKVLNFARAQGEILGVVVILYLLQGALFGIHLHANENGEHDVIAVGDTMTFWSYSLGFYSGYFRTQAVCRAIGEKCYIFVENDRWDFGDVDLNDMATILDAFENKTDAVDIDASGVLASTEGIYEKVTSVFGEPPDFDNDPRIFILVMDVRASGYSGWQYSYGYSFLGPLAHYGYFDPVNEYSTLIDTMSNEHELLYLDCLTADPGSSTALASLAHSLQRMIHWYQDPGEQRWLVEGCSMLAQFLCGYGITTGHFPPMDPFIGFSDYPFPGSRHKRDWEPSEVQNSMLLHFYFEKYGEAFISALVADNEHRGVEAIDATLEAFGYSETFSTDFEDFALTWYFLSLGLAADSSFYDGKYSLKYQKPEDVKGTVVNSFLYWCLPGFLCPPYEYTWTSSWSTAFIAMASTISGAIDSMVVFNGEDGSEYSLVVIKAYNDWFEPLDPASRVEFIALDSENRGYFDVSGFKTEYKTIYMAVVTRKLAGRGALYISDDITSPDSLHLALFHGPIDDRSLDVYVFSSEQLISGRQEFPLVEFILEGITDTVSMSMFRPDSGEWRPNESHIYHGDYILTEEGVVDLRVTGQDLSGNHAPEHRSSFTVDLIPGATGGRIVSPDGGLTLDIFGNSLAKDIWMTVIPLKDNDRLAYQKIQSCAFVNSVPDEGTSVETVYRIGPTGLLLQQPGRLTIRYDERDIEKNGDELAVYRRNSEGWTYIGGHIDREERSISTLIHRFGDYQIRAGTRERTQTRVPSTYTLGHGHPNPFNSTTTIEYGLAAAVRGTDNSERAASNHATLIVYNILGQEVRTLVNREHDPGYYTVQWDGRNNTGKHAGSGVYFYRLSVDTDGWSDTKSLVLLR